MSSLFYPLFTFLLLAMVIAYWAVTAVYPFTLLHVSVSLFRADCSHNMGAIGRDN